MLAELRREYADRIDLQIVAFPQEGIEKAPGTLGLLRRAIELGADVVGGCTYNETDVAACERHVRTAFDLAQEYGLPVDFHADLADDTTDPRYGLAGFIAATAIERGLQGRVALGHMTSLGGLAPTELAPVLEALAAARSASCCCHTPTCTSAAERTRRTSAVDSLAARFMGGRGPHELRQQQRPQSVHAVRQRGHARDRAVPDPDRDLGSPDDFRRMIEMATADTAAIVGVADTHGVRVGADADLVVLDAPDPVTALLDRSPAVTSSGTARW